MRHAAHTHCGISTEDFAVDDDCGACAVDMFASAKLNNLGLKTLQKEMMIRDPTSGTILSKNRHTNTLTTPLGLLRALRKTSSADLAASHCVVCRFLRSLLEEDDGRSAGHVRAMRADQPAFLRNGALHATVCAFVDWRRCLLKLLDLHYLRYR